MSVYPMRSGRPCEKSPVRDRRLAPESGKDGTSIPYSIQVHRIKPFGGVTMAPDRRKELSLAIDAGRAAAGFWSYFGAP